MSEEITNQTLHEILIRVEKGVAKTNGRVTTLEDEVIALGKRDSFNRGGLCIIGALIVPIVIALAISLLT